MLCLILRNLLKHMMYVNAGLEGVKRCTPIILDKWKWDSDCCKEKQEQDTSWLWWDSHDYSKKFDCIFKPLTYIYNSSFQTSPYKNGDTQESTNYRPASLLRLFVLKLDTFWKRTNYKWETIWAWRAIFMFSLLSLVVCVLMCTSRHTQTGVKSIGTPYVEDQLCYLCWEGGRYWKNEWWN